MKTTFTHQGLKALTAAKPHRIEKCLYLRVTAQGGKRWVFRWRDRATGKLRDMGLGSFPEVSLADARTEASKHRKEVKQGIDPIAERKRLRDELLASQGLVPTFAECTVKYIAAHSPSWKNKKHKQQWTNSLRDYAEPVIGPLPVNMITDEHILTVLEPVWTSKTETASRVRGRIEKILDFAAARKFRSGDNPARWRGHLDILLAKPKKLKKVKHHASLPYPDLYEFMQELRGREGIVARALEFTILTAARSSEVIGAKWSEFDLDAKVWTIPAERMKANRPHRVPLSKAAMDVLKAQKAIDETYVFPGVREGRQRQPIQCLDF